MAKKVFSQEHSPTMTAQEYDALCYQEFLQLYAKFSSSFMPVETRCPYGLSCCARFYQGRIPPLSDREMELFLFAGFRRNGNYLYSTHCPQCAACLPVRLFIPDFCANRNQRRTEKRNYDLEARILPLTATQENIALCEKFLMVRYPGNGKEENDGASYFRDFFFNSITTTIQVEYRLAGRLLGSAILDVGQNWMNAVFFYFDPDENKRSPGTWNILFLINLCRLWKIDYLYLGYLIYEVSAMSYKKHFRPYQILVGDCWQTISQN